MLISTIHVSSSREKEKTRTTHPNPSEETVMNSNVPSEQDAGESDLCRESQTAIRVRIKDDNVSMFVVM